MEWIEALKNINYIAVLVAVLSTFAVGMSWYSTSVFGKRWMKELGIKEEDMNNKDGMMKAMTMSTVGSVLTAIVLAALMLNTGTNGWLSGALFGAIVATGFAVASMLTHDAFSLKSLVLTQINGAHDIVSFAVMGAIIGGFGF